MRSRGDQSQASIADEEDESAGLGEDATQERRLVREEMSTCVRAVLRRLPEGHQSILALSDCEELSDRDIAEVLGLTVGAAKIRLHRARARMKAELERECTFYRDPENVLCCDRKEETEERDTSVKDSSSHPYLSEPGLRQQVESRTDCGANETSKQEPNMSNETLPSKQKHLIGVGAAIAAGCQPCTKSFIAAAQSAGACERGTRHAIVAGLRARESAHVAIQSFADATFAKPDLDDAFLADRKVLEALTGIAAALACNAAILLEGRIGEARRLGATDGQIRVAGQIGITARRGAEKEADAGFAKALGDTASEGCCDQPGKDCATGGCTEPTSKLAAASPCSCSQDARES